MKKITVLYDLNIMADAFHPGSSRSGIFRVAWEIFVAFSKRKDVKLIIFCDFGLFYKLQEYLGNLGFNNLAYAVIPDRRPSVRRVRSITRWVISRLKLFFDSKVIMAKNIKCDYFLVPSLLQYEKIDIG